MVMKQHGAVIGVAQLRENLYELELDLNVAGPRANLCTAEVRSLWHRRLGHTSQTTTNMLVRLNMVEGLGPKVDSVGFCDTFVRGKQCIEPLTVFVSEPVDCWSGYIRTCVDLLIRRLGTDQNISGL